MTIVTEDANLDPPETYVLMHDGLILLSTVLFTVALTSVRLYGRQEIQPGMSEKSGKSPRERAPTDGALLYRLALYSLAFGQDLSVLVSAVLQSSLYFGDKKTQIVLLQIWLTCELVAACVIFNELREASFAEQLRLET